MTWQVIEGDCTEKMREMPDASIDAIVCDPPYGLGFMGREWDDLPPGKPWADECLRVLKPGGHLLAFGGTRTYHRLACAIEDAGFEIRDCLAWLYGGGFPKSLDVSKAIDRQRHEADDKLRVTTWFADAAEANGVTRADVDAHMGTSDMGGWWLSRLRHRCAVPTLDQIPRLLEVLGVDEVPEPIRTLIFDLNGAKGQPGEAWFRREKVGTKTAGMGSGETFGMLQAEGRNADAEKIVDITAPATPEAHKWNGYGTALKPAHEPIVLARKPLVGTVAQNVIEFGTGAINVDGCRIGTGEGGDRNGEESAERRYADEGATNFAPTPGPRGGDAAGRWPANLLLDEEAAAVLDVEVGEMKPAVSRARRSDRGFAPGTDGQAGVGDLERDHLVYPDSGGPSRFFYTAKVSSAERNAGLDAPNSHPTLKPINLMRWLVRLVTPPGGTILDPFLGSGSTGCACVLEGFDFIGIERESEYVEIAKARIEWWAQNPPGTETDVALKSGKARDEIEATGQMGLLGEAA